MKIKIHLMDFTTGYKKEIKTRQNGKIYNVITRNGQKGVLYGDNNEFTPLTAFSTENGAVIFETV